MSNSLILFDRPSDSFAANNQVLKQPRLKSDCSSFDDQLLAAESDVTFGPLKFTLRNFASVPDPKLYFRIILTATHKKDTPNWASSRGR